MSFNSIFGTNYPEEYTEGEDLKVWTILQARKLSECNEYLLNYINQRHLFLCEVVLDYDKLEDFAAGIQVLNADKVNYYVYVAHRGYHVHTFFPELKPMSDEQRLKYRKALVLRYKAEPQVKSAISIENRTHHRSGKPKQLVNYTENSKQENRLPKDLDLTAVTEVQEHKAQFNPELKERLEKVLQNNKPIKNSYDLLNYSMKPQTPRHPKEFAIIICLLENNFTKEEIRAILFNTRWSKVKDKGGNSYFEFTFKKVLKMLAERQPQPQNTPCCNVANNSPEAQ